jgi:hypothetical protein
MNIFVVDLNPEVAARMLCDKHVVKMIVETAQILCTVSHNLGDKNVKYKPTHSKHPCTIWASETNDNYMWLASHGMALCKEYTLRYGKVHKSQEVILKCLTSAVKPKAIGLTNFAQAMPEQYRNNDVVSAYRNYYIGEKKFAKWNKNRSAPEWWVNKD